MTVELTASAERFAFPPLELAERSGPLRLPPGSPALPLFEQLEWWRPSDPLKRYELLGETVRREILEALPAGWSLGEGRMLDFGCGTGRVMRHFDAEARSGEVWGCDVDRASVEWAQRNLSPPFDLVVNDIAPPLPFPDDHFDLVLALSVFTHISDLWAGWLLELRRVMKPDGLMFASFLNRGALRWEGLGEEWDEDRHGMNVLHPGRPIADGGPNVYHSEWWLRAHWGRAFEILALSRDGLAFPPGHGHGWAVLRPRPGRLTEDDLERDQPDERREWFARRHNWSQIAALERTRYKGHPAVREAEALRADLERLKRSASWRLTAPLRAAKRLLRALLSAARRQRPGP